MAIALMGKQAKTKAAYAHKYLEREGAHKKNYVPSFHVFQKIKAGKFARKVRRKTTKL